MVEVPITVRYDVPNKHKMNPPSWGGYYLPFTL